MTAQSPTPLFWEFSSKNDFKRFPRPVQKHIAVALFVVQLGGTPPAAHKCIYDHDGSTYRAVYMVKIEDRIHVLQTFQKKWKSRIATPPPDVDLIEKRGKALLKRSHKTRQGTRNVLVDLAFEDAEVLSAKTTLALKLNQLMHQCQLTQTEAAERLDMAQPRISAIRNYKLQGISLERLMQAIVALGQHIEIVVRPASRLAPSQISVA